MKKISMGINYRKHWIYLSVDHQRIKISFEAGCNEVTIGAVDEMYQFKIGEVREFSLVPQA